MCRLRLEVFCSATDSLLSCRPAKSQNSSCTMQSCVSWRRSCKFQFLKINFGVGQFRNHSCVCLGWHDWYALMKFNSLVTANASRMKDWRLGTLNLHAIGRMLAVFCTASHQRCIRFFLARLFMAKNSVDLTFRARRLQNLELP